MKLYTKIALVLAFVAGEFTAYGMMEIFPPAKAEPLCQPSAEVSHVVELMGKMRLPVLGHKDEIGELISKVSR